MTVVVALIALIVERVLGYPDAVQKKIGHPVEWMGSFIAFTDSKWNTPANAPNRRRAGLLSLALLIAITLAITGLLAAFARQLPFGFVIEALLASTLLASRQLGEAVAAVATGLRLSLSAGRKAVAQIVGRDTKALDAAEMSRAAIETLAENASDGVIAPLFWLMLFGLPGIAVYKAINTADSMIGHKNDRYIDFGRAAARLDDGVNFIPARLTALLFALASMAHPTAAPKTCLRTTLRDAAKHNSPNAGWPESAMAGALGFGLGGPRAYHGTQVELPTMGDGRRDLTPNDIEDALALYRLMMGVVVGAVTLLAVIAFIW